MGKKGLYCYSVLKSLKIIYFNDQRNVKYWFSKTLCNLTLDTLPLHIPSFIYRCRLDTLFVLKTNFTINEINFLLDGGKLTYLHYETSNIHDENAILVPINKILEKTPKLTHLRYLCEDEIFTNETFEKMSALKFKSTGNFNFAFWIYQLASDVDITLLCKFVKHISGFSSNRSNFYFSFEINNADVHKMKLEAALKEMEKSWKIKVDVS